MKKWWIFAVVVMLFTAHAVASQANGEEPINLNQSLFLTPQQRVTLAVEAMRGSSEAAAKISMFYGFVALNPIEQHRWAVIAAENGDPVDQFNAYQDFMNYGTELDKERALFWLRKSASAGDKVAQDELMNLEKKNKRSDKKDGKQTSDPIKQ
ncbi:hypothetical protein P3W24_12245 [Luteibacter sp. PPL201]|uniref:Sel1 repeat family protein n=1 Tax=Luteibacter sahnii TaxID=3021977 RepID=A0ABT6BCY6_9GAMM